MPRPLAALALVLAMTGPLSGQTPQPFPRAATPAQPQPSQPQAASQPQPQAQTPPQPQSQTPAPAVAAPSTDASPAADPLAPPAATVYFPVYPTAVFIASYDAGRGQRYYVYGTTASYADLVAYYRAQLKERGDQVFQQPPTHMFSIGRFREETMAFPPGVTVKDWTWGGSQGYPNPRAGGTPGRFPTIVVIVPPPAAPAAG